MRILVLLLFLVTPLGACVGAREAHGRDLVFGVSGHPIMAYAHIDWDAQLDLVRELGATHYRVGLRQDGSMPQLRQLLDLADAKGIEIVPILSPAVDLDEDSAETIYRASYDLARRMGRAFKGRVRVWQLANELENYAIIMPCETRDDGTQYPCEWGPAAGVHELEYYGPRWRKVSAVLDGLSDGMKAGDPGALRAIGTAGFGHTGAFDRMADDGVEWDISLWHHYEGDIEWALERLAGFGKPIWITEFNYGGDPTPPDDVRAKGVRAMVSDYRSFRERYRVEGAFIYQLLDEPYWGDDFEARQGIVRVVKGEDGYWRLGDKKPSFHALRDAIARRP